MGEVNTASIAPLGVIICHSGWGTMGGTGSNVVIDAGMDKVFVQEVCTQI